MHRKINPLREQSSKSKRRERAASDYEDTSYSLLYTWRYCIALVLAVIVLIAIREQFGTRLGGGQLSRHAYESDLKTGNQILETVNFEENVRPHATHKSKRRRRKVRGKEPQQRVDDRAEEEEGEDDDYTQSEDGSDYGGEVAHDPEDDQTGSDDYIDKDGDGSEFEQLDTSDEFGHLLDAFDIERVSANPETRAFLLNYTKLEAASHRTGRPYTHPHLTDRPIPVEPWFDLRAKPKTSTRKCFAKGRVEDNIWGRWEFVSPEEAGAPAGKFGNLSCPLEWSKYSCSFLGTGTDSGQAGPGEAAKRLKFHATSCELDDFDAEGFARRIAGRNILFHGDSIQRQAFIELGCRSSALVETYDIRWGTSWPCNGVKKCIEGGEHSGFQTGCFTYKKEYGGGRVCAWYTGKLLGARGALGKRPLKNWISQKKLPLALRKIPFDMYVLNIGVHQLETELIEMYVQRLADGIRNQVAKAPQRGTPTYPTIIYRESQAQHFWGHTNGMYDSLWSRHATKMHEPTPASSCRYQLGEKAPYASLERELILPAVHASNGNARFIPFHDMTMVMGWAHVGTTKATSADCTHFCIPGPMGTFSTLLWQTLREDPSL